MKSSLLAVSVVTTVVLLSACEQETRPSRPPVPHVGQTGQVMPPTPSPTPIVEVTPTPEPSPTPAIIEATPTPTPAGVTGNIPYGVPVPGKPGFVESPFSSGAGYVDVRGFPPNTEVKDPYSGKIFRVP